MGGRRIARLALGLTVLGLLAGCGSKAEPTPAPRRERPPDRPAASAVAACQTEYRTVKTAAEAFNAQMGRYPMAMSELTADQAFLRGTPTYVDLGPRGTVTATAATPAGCLDGGDPPTTTAVGGPTG